ncbi:hypothetical protein QYF61_025202 [Mycteria americana]|uniref:Uncharacterized protein n=1 Tax=Mycteria americana TaxID=33587 RepID=A0AAN7NFI3_MYCAM|nr:hypothetical protein QYF61_025202 [Mycteria americana]
MVSTQALPYRPRLDSLLDDRVNILGFSIFNQSHAFFQEFVQSLNQSWQENCDHAPFTGPAVSYGPKARETTSLLCIRSSAKSSSFTSRTANLHEPAGKRSGCAKMTQCSSERSGLQEIAGSSGLVVTLPVNLVRRHLPTYESQRDQRTQRSCCTPMLCNRERFPPQSLQPKLPCCVEDDLLALRSDWWQREMAIG